MRSRLTLFANVVRICVHTNMHRRACLHHRIHRRSVLRPRESIVYTFQYGKQTPLANKYSLDVSRDRLIPTHKYTCSYHIYDTRDSIRYIYIYIERSNACRNVENFWNDAFFQFVTRANEWVNSNSG